MPTGIAPTMEAPKSTRKEDKMETPKLHKILSDIINECQRPGETIYIESLTRGYKVTVGCRSFAFERQMDMITAISLLLHDQQSAQAAFSKHMGELVGTDAPPLESAQCEAGENLRSRLDPVRVGYPDEDRPG